MAFSKNDRSKPASPQQDSSQLLLDSLLDHRKFLRESDEYPNLKAFWATIVKLKMDRAPKPAEHAPVCELVSAAYDFVLAHKWGRVRSGMKRSERNAERNAKNHLRGLSKMAAEIRGALMFDGTESSVLRTAYGGLLLDPRTEKVCEELRWIGEVLQTLLTGPSQSDMQLKFRKLALARMVKTNFDATGQQRWELIRDVVYLASGENQELSRSADSYRHEHQNSASATA
jgi:hypothetical protein